MRRVDTGHARSFEARFAGAGVGVTGVDDKGAEVEAAPMLRVQMRTANRNRCSAKPVLREYAGRDRASLRDGEYDIVASPILDSCGGGAERDARYRQKRFRRRRCVADGHLGPVSRCGTIDVLG